ncbi:hypothetical protein IQ25_01330 [Novosphingobium taihuense]|nr:hypothetical protein IQ25_01330 [Novosphingobium taihuense]
MISRHAEQDFSSAMVFPGGIVDPSDHDETWLQNLHGDETLCAKERALRIAAFRETFEECGLLLARGPDGTHVDSVQHACSNFQHAVQEAGAVLHLDDLVHFAHWITPETNVRRYDTHFFLAVAPHRQEACCDGNEAMEVVWASPSQILEEAAAGKRKVVFPTRLNLELLAKSRTVAEALAAAKARKVITVLPRIEKRDGVTKVVIPPNAGYGRAEEHHATR